MPLYRFQDLPPTPWRNGGGVTREVLRLESSLPGGDFAARVSIADVDAGGPFSRFDDVDRIIMLLRGEQMRLDAGGQRVVLTPGQPFAFPGDVPTRCEIDAPTRDLNVMTRRGEATATMTALRGKRHTVGGVGTRVVIVGMENGADVTPPPSTAHGGDPAHLADLDCFVWDGAEALTVTGDAAVIVIR